MNYLKLDKNKIETVGKSLNELLATYHVHYQNLRNFHWNLKSNHFFTLHEKFEEFYEDAHDKIDDIAERILTLKIKPLSNFSDYLKISNIEENGRDHSDRAMVEFVLNDFTHLIEGMRKVINDADDASDEGTIDLIGAFLRETEKNCWMLESWLEKGQEVKFSTEEFVN